MQQPKFVDYNIHGFVNWKISSSATESDSGLDWFWNSNMEYYSYN